LRVYLYEPGGRRALPLDPERLIGSVNYDFDVPDMNEGRSDEPLDLGTIELKIKKRVNQLFSQPH